MSEPIDVARLAVDSIEDAWEALAESYAVVGLTLVAVLQRTGPITIPRNFEDRARGLVVLTEPLSSGAWRVSVIPREESGTDLVADAAHVRAKMESQYERKAAP